MLNIEKLNSVCEMTINKFFFTDSKLIDWLSALEQNFQCFTGKKIAFENF